MAQWIMLPADLVQIIAEFLTEDIREYIRFRAVCKPWRAVTVDLRTMPSLPPQLPWLMLSSDEAFTNTRSFYRLSDRSILNFHLPELAGKRIVGSADGWLLSVGAPSTISLFNPLTRAQIQLPPLRMIPQLLQSLVEEADAENVDIEEAQEDQGEEAVRRYFMDSDHAKDLLISKAIIIHSDNMNDCVIVMMLSCLGKLVFARPGDIEWTTPDQRFYCTDILWHQGQLYAVGMGGAVGVCELNPNFEITKITDRIDSSCWCYLVEFGGDLLVVFRYPQLESDTYLRRQYTTTGFEVFKLDRSSEEARPVELKSLGDHILFLGKNSSFALSTKDFPGWKGNCIYFTASYFNIIYRFADDYIIEYRQKGQDFGVFDLDDGKVKPFPWPCHADSSQFVWPPPMWFQPNPLD
ncbi:F-box protein At2g26160-like [Elaeis guineensis]|uniref:F-box protein At2g26160-like n=1 Tax=Elaeis guineensis var. tenera TaxID=51953 RepID=UPI00057A66DB